MISPWRFLLITIIFNYSWSIPLPLSHVEDDEETTSPFPVTKTLNAITTSPKNGVKSGSIGRSSSNDTHTGSNLSTGRIDEHGDVDQHEDEDKWFSSTAVHRRSRVNETFPASPNGRLNFNSATLAEKSGRVIVAKNELDSLSETTYVFGQRRQGGAQEQNQGMEIMDNGCSCNGRKAYIFQSLFQDFRSLNIYDFSKQIWLTAEKSKMWRLDGRQNFAVTSHLRNIYIIGGDDWLSHDPSSRTLNSVQRYNARFDEVGWNPWTTLRPRLRIARGDSAAVTFGDKLYVCGGSDPSLKYPTNYLNSCEMLDLTNGTSNEKWWKKFAPMIETRSEFALVALGSSLYAIGGVRQTGHKIPGSSHPPISTLQSVERISLRKRDTMGTEAIENKWSSGPMLNDHKAGFAATVFQGKIYIGGGYQRFDDATLALNSFERLDIQKGIWEVLRPFDHRIINFGFTGIGNQLYAFTGCTIKKYDSEKNIWSLHDVQPACFHNFGFSVLWSH